VLATARSEPVLRWRSLTGAAVFAAFGCFWTTVTFLLSGPEYGFSQLGIGLFALVGAAGAATASFGGRFLDARRELRWAATGAALALMAVSFVPIGLAGTGLGGWSLALLVIGVLLMDACVQAVHVTNQSVIYDLLPAARSRLTTIYMTTYFIGGAAGSAAGAQAYEQWGWAGASATAAAFPVLGLAAWLGGRRHEAVTPSGGTTPLDPPVPAAARTVAPATRRAKGPDSLGRLGAGSEDAGQGVQGAGGERVVGPHAALVPGEDACVDEHLEVVRDRRLGQPERLGQLAHARFTVLVRGDHRDQPEPGRIGQRLEQLGQVRRLVRRNRLFQQRSAGRAHAPGRLNSGGGAHFSSMRRVSTRFYANRQPAPRPRAGKAGQATKGGAPDSLTMGRPADSQPSMPSATLTTFQPAVPRACAA
jgi:hypothetical protein